MKVICSDEPIKILILTLNPVRIKVNCIKDAATSRVDGPTALCK
jgi:hypothetical protein